LAKILLVEDDFALRDIYSARLAAEGHTVVTASDGEEALAVAMREHPDLILLDVMMPKISGFDVLDILRSTPETKATQVIMMTALGQESDRKRGEALGVNKYLVKSQVTLEDVIVAVKQVLGEDGGASAPATAASAAPAAPASPATPAASPPAAPADPLVTTVPHPPATEAAPATPPATPPSNPPTTPPTS
jgi:DNA-binding response OmpR family regulator